VLLPLQLIFCHSQQADQKILGFSGKDAGRWKTLNDHMRFRLFECAANVDFINEE